MEILFRVIKGHTVGSQEGGAGCELWVQNLSQGISESQDESEGKSGTQNQSKNNKHAQS